jgi:DNA invertase Pin-like site-specific DNA recombinase
MASGRFVAYYRVSTLSQGRSGLGLEGQRHAVTSYLNGGRWKLVKEFVEVESGRKAGRPELSAALAACRIHDATLVVAKLDRLSRNAAFLLALRDSNVECIAADMPDANRLTLGIMALIAEHEAEAISARTKAALAAAKRRGVILGNPAHLTRKAQQKGVAASAKARSRKAKQRAQEYGPTIDKLRAKGAVSLRQIARGLNDEGIPAERGGAWSAAQVQRLLARLDPARG